MNGISSKALNLGEPENKKGFNGNELQEKEFTISDLAWYDFNARTYDQQIGRFMQIDPSPDDGDQESFTPYQFGLDNSILNSDPNGKCHSCFVGALVGFVVDASVQVTSSVTILCGYFTEVAGCWSYDVRASWTISFSTMNKHINLETTVNCLQQVTIVNNYTLLFCIYSKSDAHDQTSEAIAQIVAQTIPSVPVRTDTQINSVVICYN